MVPSGGGTALERQRQTGQTRDDGDRDGGVWGGIRFVRQTRKEQEKMLILSRMSAASRSGNRDGVGDR